MNHINSNVIKTLDAGLSSLLKDPISGDEILLTSPLVHPPRPHKSIWIQEEINLLLELLRSSYPLSIIKNYFKLRSDGAIIKKAQRYGYGRHLQEDGSLIFTKGVKSRKRRTKTDGAVLVSVTREKSEKFSESIVAKNSSFTKRKHFDPNRSAFRMLQRANLPFDPDVVCVLSKHIIKHKVE